MPWFLTPQLKLFHACCDADSCGALPLLASPLATPVRMAADRISRDEKFPHLTYSAPNSAPAPRRIQTSLFHHQQELCELLWVVQWGVAGLLILWLLLQAGSLWAFTLHPVTARLIRHCWLSWTCGWLALFCTAMKILRQKVDVSKENTDGNICMFWAAAVLLCHIRSKYLHEKTDLAFHHCLEVPSRPASQAAPEEPLQTRGLCAGSDLGGGVVVYLLLHCRTLSGHSAVVFNTHTFQQLGSCLDGWLPNLKLRTQPNQILKITYLIKWETAILLQW